MIDDLNTILNEAVPRWAKLTGTKLGTDRYVFRIGSDSQFQEYALKTYIDDLNEARQRDTSGGVAIMLLRGLFEAYVTELAFGGRALLFEHERVEQKLGPLRTFHASIHQEPCQASVTDFLSELRTAATHYGYDLQKLKKLLSDEMELAKLRLSALRSIEKLKVHQFSQGDPDSIPLQYNKQIFEFYNINSFIHALRQQWVSGITLTIICDPSVYFSYFCLGMRNGDIVTVLTDFDEGAHPEHKRMSRRPDRLLERRAEEHWFPYRLLKSKDADPVESTTLVPLNTSAVPIEEVSNLEPEEFIWLILLFDLIKVRYGENAMDHVVPQLSYTGEMVITPHVLIEATNALVQSGKYQPLILPILTVDTATSEAADTRKSVGHNAWMEERYACRVPDAVLDIVGDQKALELSEQTETPLSKDADDNPDLPDLPELRRQPNTLIWDRKDLRKEPIHLSSLDPTYFGTRDQIQRNRAWVARRNLMKVVQRYATADFVAKKQQILSWYRARLERNMPRLLEAVARGMLLAPTWEYKSHANPGNPFPWNDSIIEKPECNILQQKSADRFNKAFPGEYLGLSGVLFGEKMWPESKCYLDKETRATVFSIFSPDNPKALAVLLGIKESKLPWPLQHWTTREPYTGNHILDRIDPQDSLLDNPWRHLDLHVKIVLCKREFAKLCKQHNVVRTIEVVDSKPAAKHTSRNRDRRF